MRRESTGVSHLFKLSDEEAVTLRHVAFGESDMKSLRRADVERLLRLRLIAEGRSSMVLTISGKEHFDSLPRAAVAAAPGRRNER